MLISFQNLVILLYYIDKDKNMNLVYKDEDAMRDEVAGWNRCDDL